MGTLRLGGGDWGKSSAVRGRGFVGNPPRWGEFLGNLPGMGRKFFGELVYGADDWG